jgi:hypothetical protein
MLIAKDCDFLISYWEVFEWGDFFCIKMEYCKLGDLQNQLDNERIFTEKVNLNQFLFYYFFITIFFNFYLYYFIFIFI